MTFIVLSKSDEKETVIGTIWAEAEPQAQMIASDLCCKDPARPVIVRRGEEREIPLRLTD
jgi:hypothetical protein